MFENLDKYLPLYYKDEEGEFQELGEKELDDIFGKTSLNFIKEFPHADIIKEKRIILDNTHITISNVNNRLSACSFSFTI